jgi:tetratricopeptide (TPR) repeat protein
MELTDNDLILINNYFNQMLAETDANAFEKRLKTDAAFSKAVNEYQATAAILNTVREREQKAFLSAINATIPPFEMEKPVRRLNYRWWAMAATGLVLISVGLWFFRGNTEGSLKSVAKDYFEPYPALGITRGDEAKDVTNDALRTYAVNDFKQAIPLLEKSFQLNKDSVFLFYKSIAYLGNGQSAEAAPILNSLQNSDKVPIESVEWYLALAYIDLKQKEKALILLKKAANTEGGYQTKAKELLGKL